MKNLFLNTLLALSFTFNVSSVSFASTPHITLGNVVSSSPNQVVLSVDGLPTYGKITKADNPSDTIAQIGEFKLEHPAIVNLKLNNNAKNGIVYYRLAKTYTNNDVYSEFSAGDYTIVIPAGHYYLKTNFVSIDDNAKASFKSNISAAQFPITSSYNTELSRAYSIDPEEEILNAFYTGKHKPKSHYYKFKTTEKNQIVTFFAKQASGLSETYIEILDTEGNSLTKQTSFNLNNTLEKNYKVSTEGTYVLKISTDENLGGVYYFYMR